MCQPFDENLQTNEIFWAWKANFGDFHVKSSLGVEILAKTDESEVPTRISTLKLDVLPKKKNWKPRKFSHLGIDREFQKSGKFIVNVESFQH